ncbi:hypothetical protein GOP47_0004583, partial [Adiantum capillus-veneris]
IINEIAAVSKRNSCCLKIADVSNSRILTLLESRIELLIYQSTWDEKRTSTIYKKSQYMEDGLKSRISCIAGDSCSAVVRRANREETGTEASSREMKTRAASPLVAYSQVRERRVVSPPEQVVSQWASG